MYPLNLVLDGRPVLVIGGGRIAARKIKALLAAHAHVVVVSPHLDADIDAHAVCWQKTRYAQAQLAGFSLIFACTDDAALNAQVFADAEPWQWVNNVSDKSQSDFYNVAVIRDAGFVITISTDGAAPTQARLMKQALQQWLIKEEAHVSDRSQSQ